MADDVLIQGKSYPWLVDDQGRAYVSIKDERSLVTRYDVVDATISYVGKAPPGSATGSAVWQVMRLTSNSQGDVIIEFADGDANFDNVWDNRASLSYS